MVDQKIAGRVLVNKDEESKEAVITVGDNENNEIYFSTEEKDGDYFLVVKIEDLKKIIELYK